MGGGRGRGKFYTSAYVGGLILTFFTDTGSEVSLVPRKWAKFGDVSKLKKPIKITGYDGRSSQTITEKVGLVLDFICTHRYLEFLICDVHDCILGNDILKDSRLNVMLNTKTSMLTVGKRKVGAHSSSAASRAELRRRGVPSSSSPDWWGTVWALTATDTWMMPSASTCVTFGSSVKGLKGKTAMLSLFDENADVYVPSSLHDSSLMVSTTWVTNNTDEKIFWPKGTRIGELVRCYDIDGKLPAKSFRGVCAVSTAIDGPVPLSTLVDNGRVPDEQLERMRTEGVEMDLSTSFPTARMDLPENVEIDIEEEKKKAAACIYWDDKDQLLSRFNLKDVSEEVGKQLGDLMYDFRHVFHNTEKDAQMKEGIRIPPIEIAIDPSVPPPRKERPRRLNEKKIAALQKHVDTLLKQGVIEPVTDAAGVILSPVNCVFEIRYLAKERRNVEKTRMVLDLRGVNKMIVKSSYPLPLCDQFRKKIAADGIKVFSNFDASSFYFQFKTAPHSYKRLFAFNFEGKLYWLTRLPMGASTSGAHAQLFMDYAFARHPRAFPYLDDVTVASRDIKEHIEMDLPLCFAIASYFNIIFKPAKADLAQPSCRVLGFEVGQGAESLANEKKEKIESMTFPVTKAEAVSRCAFFSYFLPLSNKLTELMSGLRRLAAPKVRFSPTQTDRDEFDRLKNHLLDPKIGAIRFPSASPSDAILVFTDSSCHAMSALMTQMLPPLPESGLDLSKKYLHIVGCFSKSVPDGWTSHPIWLLELAALDECCHRHRNLLLGRIFYILTDSQTVRHWASMTRVPSDIARKVMRLQEFQYKVLWIQGTVNPSDWLSRVDTDRPTACTFPSFLQNQIFNSKGEPVDHRSLFSDRKCQEAEDFFSSPQTPSFSGGRGVGSSRRGCGGSGA